MTSSKDSRGDCEKETVYFADKWMRNLLSFFSVPSVEFHRVNWPTEQFFGALVVYLIQFATYLYSSGIYQTVLCCQKFLKANTIEVKANFFYDYIRELSQNSKSTFRCVK